MELLFFLKLYHSVNDWPGGWQWMRHVCRMQPGDDPRRAHDFLWVERALKTKTNLAQNA